MLVADVAGYSRLMGDDERATIATLDEFRAVFREHIESNDGRVIDMAGDSVLAVFDSANAAVSAAIDAQAELGKRNEGFPDDRIMEFRVGVNSGDIQEKSDGTIYGDGVNVAARLEAMARPGGVNVSGSVFDSVRSKAGVSFDYLGEHEVKNIAEPVRAYRVLGENDELTGWLASILGRRKFVPTVSLAAAILTIIVVGTWFGWREDVPSMVGADGSPTDDPVLAMPNGPSIVVVPFENLSDDAGHDIFALGLSKEITTALSRFSEIFVFSLDAARHLQGEGKTPGDIGRELGARYVLSGSVVRSRSSLRVSATLAESRDASIAWAETYDRDLSAKSLFDVQDDIAASVSGTLVGHASVTARIAREEARQKRPENLTAYDCVLLERAYWDYYTEEWHLKTRTCLERVVAEDPTYAPAWVSLAWMFSEERLNGYNARDLPLDRALEAARRAVNLDRLDSIAYNSLANMHFYRREYDEFLVAADRAITLNPNNVEVLTNIELRYAQLDMLDRGEALLEKSKRLNPYPPNWFFWGDFWVALGREDHEATLEAAQKLFVDGYFVAHGALAAAYANLGREAEASAAIAAILELVPGYTLEDMEDNLRLYLGSDRLLMLMIDACRRSGLKSESFTN